MLCPDCRELLVIVECEGVELDVCHAGHGIWFDEDELRQLFEVSGVPEALYDLERRLPAFGRQRGPRRRCPRCRGRMVHVEAPAKETVILDRCPRGHGLWFDEGELHAVLSVELAEGDEALERIRRHLGAFVAPREEDTEG